MKHLGLPDEPIGSAAQVDHRGCQRGGSTVAWEQICRQRVAMSLGLPGVDATIERAGIHFEPAAIQNAGSRAATVTRPRVLRGHAEEARHRGVESIAAIAVR